MTNLEIIRAWKDEEYRLSLSNEQRAMIPEHPVGAIELFAEQLAEAYYPHSGVRPTVCVPEILAE